MVSSFLTFRLSYTIRFIVLNENLDGFYSTVPGYIASGEVAKPKEHLIKGLDNVRLFFGSEGSVGCWLNPFVLGI